MTNETRSDRDAHDLVLSRRLDAPRADVWQALTRPDLVRQWFAPKPWSTAECEMDLRPGGIFRTVMRSPEGEHVTNVGCLLEVVEGRRLAWTDALAPGFQPAERPFFTAVITLEDEAGGTRCTARALHKDEADRRIHEEMGFHEGWGQCLAQLEELVRSQA